MRFLTIFALLVACGLMSMPVMAQCNAVPYIEDFETTTLSTTTTPGGTTYPGFWNLDPTSTFNWNGDVGGTGSTNTGPAVDFNPGTSTGVYIYLETSGERWQLRDPQLPGLRRVLPDRPGAEVRPPHVGCDDGHAEGGGVGRLGVGRDLVPER